MPAGINVIFNFTAKVDCLAEATAYLGFTSTRALETFVDTVGTYDARSLSQPD